ncbi:hypothetical protein [Teichococcus aestuarii]|uniref:hypothetical protein n=1 Tax=Teichococcus aestuarii TaxID=568898 RepID=UPI00360D6598
MARNVLANLVGMAVSIAVQAGLAFGGYRLAGAEQYGLIGFFTVLMTAAAIFDAGLGQTATRAVARQQVEDPAGTGSLVFNFLLIYRPWPPSSSSPSGRAPGCWPGTG